MSECTLCKHGPYASKDKHRCQTCFCINPLGGSEYTHFEAKDTNVLTNAQRIRSMTDEELAKRNVRKIKTPVTGCYDYGESYTDYYDAWETSDGAIFWTEKPAVEYELHWLQQPYEGENK